jgi:hypothetical protein
MTEEQASLPAVGWYADPRVPKQLRWWDGAAWTNNVHMPDTGTMKPPAADLVPGIAEQSGGKWDWPQATDSLTKPA